MLLERSKRLVEGAKANNMRTTTLDAITNGRAFQLLKLDTQGAEMMVLRGATRTLEHVEVLLTEMAVVPFNVGAPTWIEMMTFVTQLGFQPYDVTELHYLSQKLFQIDIAFVRAGSALWKCVEQNSDLPLTSVEEGERAQAKKQHMLHDAAP